MLQVAGTMFQTHWTTLDRHPDTLLGSEEKFQYYDNTRYREWYTPASERDTAIFKLDSLYNLIYRIKLKCRFLEISREVEGISEYIRLLYFLLPSRGMFTFPHIRQDCFESILFYYQDGILRSPKGVKEEVSSKLNGHQEMLSNDHINLQLFQEFRSLLETWL